MSWGKLPLLVLALTLASGRALALPTCESESARRALACPAGGKPFDASGARVSATFRTVAPKAARNSTPTKPPPPAISSPNARLQARQRKILVDEVLKVESLFNNTKASSPDREGIARRLADDYVELESAAFRDKTEAEMRARGKAESSTIAESGRLMRSAQRRAIELYGLLARDYPTSPRVDEVLYYLAYEHEQAGDLKSARAAYYDLIKKAPGSRFIPNAYLAFGELFFNEAQGDPSRWPLAEQAYAEVIRFPAPQNKVLGYALYKLAYVHWNRGALDKALDAFKKTVVFGVANPSLPSATKLAETARHDIIPVYALAGDPKQAFVFFKSVAGDGGSNDKTFKMMDELGAAFVDTGHYAEAIALYKDLLSRDRGSPARSCGYQARIADAVMTMRPADKSSIVSELEGLLKVASDVRSRAASPSDELRVCGNRTASLVIETAMAWHIEAIGGSPTQRGTGDKKTMAFAARLYQRSLDTFRKEELATYEFPRLVKEDWPTTAKIKIAMADLLYSDKDWNKCGPAFDAVVAEDPAAPDAAKYAYAAALCYQAADEEAHHGERPSIRAGEANTSSLRPREMSPAESAKVRAFDRYVCGVRPAEGDKAGVDQLVEVKYARARTYFEAQRWEEAALAFREIAFEHAERDLGLYAAQMYLESANILNRWFNKETPDAPACETEMSADVPKLVALYCASAERDKDACASFRRVEVDLLRRRAERLVGRADALSAEGVTKTALSLYADAGAQYHELFRRHCQDPMARGLPPEPVRCDELAYNAARAFQAGRLLAKAITVRLALITFDERTHGQSPLAKSSAYDVGSNYQAIAVYDRAAEWFERYVRVDAKSDKAERALADAVVLRLGLGQEGEAVKDADDLIRLYGATKPVLTGAVAFAIGAHYADKDEWEKARAALSSPTMRAAIDRGPVDIRIEAHATLGRVYARIGRDRDAAREYAEVRRLWVDPASAEKRIRDAYREEDDAQRDRRVRRAITAVGEAMFALADAQRRAEVDTLIFPEYRGSYDVASVKRHIETRVKSWYEKKMVAIARVEAEYAKVLDLKPEPPPRWIIAAGARSGLMWGDFVDDFRRAPFPKAWRGTPAEQVYTTNLDVASEPYKRDRARPALKKCLDLATRYQYFDAFSRSCEVWLAKNFKQEYHVVDELRGAPTLVNGGLSERAPPVTSSGASVLVADNVDRPRR